MDRTEFKLALVTRRTRLEDLVSRFNTVGQARFYVEHMGADFGDYLREHEAYVRARVETEAALLEIARVQTLDRALVPNYVFGGTHAVIVLGQDGTVANTLKYLDGQPVVGVNPDPARWDGVLVPFASSDVRAVVPEVLHGAREARRITMARVDLGDGQVMHAVNDLFVGPRSHTSARYRLRAGGVEEDQSSSGVVISTGLGSTGWLKSLLAGAYAIAAANGASAKAPPIARVPWDAEYLQFTVREPFPSRTTSANLVCGRIARGESLELMSQMGEGGVIFSDGIEQDYLEFRSGVTATVRVAEKEGRLVV